MRPRNKQWVHESLLPRGYVHNPLAKDFKLMGRSCPCGSRTAITRCCGHFMYVKKYVAMAVKKWLLSPTLKNSGNLKEILLKERKETIKDVKDWHKLALKKKAEGKNLCGDCLIDVEGYVDGCQDCNSVLCLTCIKDHKLICKAKDGEDGKTNA